MIHLFGKYKLPKSIIILIKYPKMLARGSIQSIVSRQILSPPSASNALVPKRWVQIKELTPEEVDKQTLARRKSLPVSPHLSIYKFPLPAISSITNRVTGVVLSVGLSAAALVALQGSTADVPMYIDTFKVNLPLLVPIAKMFVGFPFVYHTLNGVRHLIWDKTVKGLELASVYSSSVAIFASSGVITVLLGFLSF